MTIPKDVFEESTVYALTKKLMPRKMDLESIIEMSELKIVAVTGARRTGKTSVLMLLAQILKSKNRRAAYINAEDTRVPPENVLEEAIKWFGDEGYLIIDEVTSAGDWEGWLARNHDLLKGKLRIIVSSSRSGLVVPPKVLRGRIFNFEVFPLSFKEFLSFQKVPVVPTTAGRGKMEMALEEYMRFGGFPEIVLLKDGTMKIAVLMDYFQQILALDVAESSRNEVAQVRAFGRYVLHAPYFSATRCLNAMKSAGYKVGKEKMLELENCSQQSYLFFFSPVIGRSVKEIERYPRKAFPVDTGFLTASGIEDMGRIAECIVFLQVRRDLRPGDEVYYWRGEKDEEVDIVVRKGKTVMPPVQVCLDISEKRTREREIRSLVRCLDELKADEGTIVVMNGEEGPATEDPRIKIVNLTNWLLKGQ